MKNLIYELCSNQGVSGDENNISKLVYKKLSKYCKCKIRNDGSVIGTIGNVNAEYNILFDAHIDQIGLIVTYIDDNGFAKISNCGGIDSRILPGSTVKTCKDPEITGIICSIPPHLSKKGSDKVPSIDELYIDFAMSYEEIKKYINVGDRLSLFSEFQELLNQRVSSPSIDNRAGVAVLIKLAEKLSKENLDHKVTILLSSQEETSSMGAITSSYECRPDEAIVIDVSFAKQPGVDSNKYSKLDKGPLIGISPSLSKKVTNLLIKTAQKKDIPYQLEIMGGKTGTNADHISINRGGVNCGLLSIPQRYMHTAVEVVSIKDMEDTTELLFNYAKKGGTSK